MTSPSVLVCPRCQGVSCQTDRIAMESETEARVVIKCDTCRHRWSNIVVIDEHWPEVRRRVLQQSDFRN